MTRRSIAAVLSSILVALTVALQSPAVRAYEPCDNQAENRCAAIVPAVEDATQFHAQVVASPAQTTEPRATYRVGDSVYYIPVSGGMWAVLDYQSGGIFVIEDFVSGPPPANGVALDDVHEIPEPAGMISCADEMLCPWLYSR
jgi:hypothetical protein